MGPALYIMNLERLKALTIFGFTALGNLRPNSISHPGVLN